MVIPGISISDRSAIGLSGGSTAGADGAGLSCWRLLQIESALSPIRLFSTNSRAIAVSMSSSPTIDCNPSNDPYPVPRNYEYRYYTTSILKRAFRAFRFCGAGLRS